MTGTATASPGFSANRLWQRELDRYPATGPRVLNLTIVVLATIVLYYQFYVAGAVATRIIAEYHMSFAYYVNISVVGYLLGAAASFTAGLADKYGRANIVAAGLLLTGLLCLFAIPNAHSKIGFAIAFIAVAFVEGVILVATPALIRDFSPQLGRASAMGFWTLGPVLGSLVVSLVVSNSSDTRPWQDQFVICGIVGLVIFLIAALGLRELAPRLRDQLMVSERDRALVEAKAKGIDVEASLRKPFRQMLKPDIVGSAFAISVFLIIYYLAVGFFPVYFQTVFGYSQSRANGLGNWFWAFDALALLITGFVSDLVRVRKPFMLVGAIGAIVFTIIFASKATQPDTSYSTFVVLLILLSAFLGVAYAPWMASFTETAERRNPALAATALGVWGLVIRIVIAIAVFFVPYVVNTVTTLVDTGPSVQAMAAGADPSLSPAQNATVKAVAADPTIVPKVQGLAAQYSDQLVTAAAIDPATQAALLANPADVATQTKAVGEIATARQLPPADAVTKLQALAQVPAADLAYLAKYAPGLQDPQVQNALKFLQANAPGVEQAAKDSPGQWQAYFWIAVGGEVVFIPLIFVMAGFWDPRKAKKHQEDHEREVEAELARMETSA
jgi:MFS family permease